jgi:hypothetical protein
MTRTAIATPLPELEQSGVRPLPAELTTEEIDSLEDLTDSVQLVEPPPTPDHESATGSSVGR